MKKLSVMLGLFLFPACIHKSCIQSYATHNKHIPISIQMPENSVVFANLSLLVYDALWEQFSRVGCVMEPGGQERFTLKTKIFDATPTHKFISADVLTYGVRMKLTLQCQLLDFAGTLCAQKTFSFSTFIARPRDHVCNDAFVDYEYKKMLRRGASQIDMYFRPYMFKKRES